MRVLFLAPQPFFQERGTPIAVRLALRSLSERGEDEIDVLTYNEGEPVSIPRVNVRRIWSPSWLQGVGPGVSLKKLLCDVIFSFTALVVVWRARKDQYALIHAVEESVFVALVLKLIFGIPYIYDMDSSLAMQLTEKWSVLRPFQSFFNFFEKLAVKSSLAVVPVCDALAVIANSHGSPATEILSDISLLEPGAAQRSDLSLQSEAGVPQGGLIALYIGNLERYQGIDLLLESFREAFERAPNGYVVIIGGRPGDISFYRERAEQLGIASRVKLLGSRPVADLSAYLSQADILLSPRVKGNNTPMKIYSYLHSGKALLATDLPTHTQVLHDRIALLAKPDPKQFAEGLVELFNSAEKRSALGQAAQSLAEQRYTYTAFSTKLCGIYEMVKIRLGKQSSESVVEKMEIS